MKTTKAKITKKDRKPNRALKSKKKMPTQFEPIPEFTTSEIQDAIDRLKRGKAGDSKGVRAEQLKKLQ